MPRILGRDLSRRDLLRRTGRLEQFAGVTAGAYADGPECGVRYLDLRSGGGIELRVLIDRAFDIGELRADGISLGWRSANGFRAPGLHRAEEDEGAGLLRSLDGFLVTCGLDHVRGAAEGSAAHFGTRRTRVRYPLHGRIHATPARLVGYGERWDGEDCVLWCEGETRQTMLYGETLVLRRRIEVPLGGTGLSIRDRVENAGFRPTPHMILYHVNLGWPLLDEGTALALDGAFARADLRGAIGGAPAAADTTAGDELFEAGPGPGEAACAVINEGLAGGLAVELTFDTATLPNMQIWRNLSEGIYVLAVEPANHPAAPRADLDRDGRVRHLAPGETVEHRLRLTVHRGPPAIAALRARLAAPAGDGAAPPREG
ncbi:MAG: aldose 1-epimerase family protein [Alphaproteobacteria bacterium]|nr:aldose 1-epimerase family protein [Alphaproteobacteria bacterium]